MTIDQREDVEYFRSWKPRKSIRDKDGNLIGWEGHETASDDRVIPTEPGDLPSGSGGDVA